MTTTTMLPCTVVHSTKLYLRRPTTTKASILKRRHTAHLKGVCPKPTAVHMADLDDPTEPSKSRSRDLSGRADALAQWKDVANVDAMGEQNTTTPRLVFAGERARRFEITDAPAALMMTPEEEEAPIQQEFSVELYRAAVAVDRLVQYYELMHAGKSEEEAAKDMACRMYAQLLEEGEDVAGWILKAARCEARGEALAQAEDLLERCQTRVAALEGLEQTSVRLEMHKRAESKVWTPEDDAEYMERIAQRVPDALTQRYLLRRSTRASPFAVTPVGLDAKPGMVACLEQTIEALKRE